MNILGIIGARSGSKGVKDKNIRRLLGKPLIGRIIETSKESKYISRVIVSTDSKHYADIAREFGAEVPFLRPEEFSFDLSSDYDYVLHAVKWLKSNENYEPDIVIRLVATVPLQTTEDIDLCTEELMKDSSAHSAVVISEACQHPLKALKLVDDKKGGSSQRHLIKVGGSPCGQRTAFSYSLARKTETPQQRRRDQTNRSIVLSNSDRSLLPLTRSLRRLASAVG